MEDSAKEKEPTTSNMIRLDFQIGKLIRLVIDARPCDLTELRSFLLPILVTLLLLLIAAFAPPII